MAWGGCQAEVPRYPLPHYPRLVLLSPYCADPRPTMAQAPLKFEPPTSSKNDRLHLIARVQVAYELLKETMQKAREDNSARAKAAVAIARKRLQILNRALAMMALQQMQIA